MTNNRHNLIADLAKFGFIVVAATLFVVVAVRAGSLTPSSSPASTMYTLEQIYESIASTSYDSSAISASQNGSLLQILKYINSNLGWASSSSDIYNTNSGKVGIGTSMPLTKLEVEGTASASNLFTSGGLQVGGTTSASRSYSRFGTDLTGHSLSAVSDVLISGLLETNGQAYFDSNASVAGNFETLGWASASQTFGSGLVDCDNTTSSKLLWDYSTGKFSCGTDAGGIKTEEGGVQNLAAATILNFDPGKFTLTASGSTESIVNMDWGTGGPASLSQDSTVSGNWNFSNTASHTAAGEWNFDSNTFVIDSGVNRVGIGTSTPEQSLEILGAASMSGNFWVGGYASISGNLDVGRASVSQLFGANLVDCDTADTSKLLWDVSTGKFSCGTDQTTAASSSANFDPGSDNAYYLGDPNYRWKSGYFSTGLGVNSGNNLDTALEVGGTASISGDVYLRGRIINTKYKFFDESWLGACGIAFSGTSQIPVPTTSDTNFTACRIAFDSTNSVNAGNGQFSIPDDTIPYARIAVDASNDGTGGSGYIYFGTVDDVSYAIQASNSPSFDISVKPSVTNKGFGVEFGFTNRGNDADLSAAPTNGVYFRKDQDSSWEAVTINGGVTTTSSTSVSVDTTAFHRMRADIDGTTNPNQVKFYIDDRLVVTHNGANNVPSANLTLSVAAHEISTLPANSNLDIGYMRVWVDDPDLSPQLALNVVKSKVVGVVKGDTTEKDIISTANISEQYYVDNKSLFTVGDVVSLDTASNLAAYVRLSSGSYDRDVLGVISDTGALSLGTRDSNTVNVAVNGRTAINVSLDGGSVKKGDYLTSSSVPGVAMKAASSGKIIGTALEDFDGTDPKTLAESNLDATRDIPDLTGKQRRIVARINSIWYDASLDNSSGGSSSSALDQLFGEFASSSFNNGNGNGSQAKNIKSLLAILLNMMKTSRLTVDTLETGRGKASSMEITKGITMFDTATSQPYCLAVENGVTKTAPGYCEPPIIPSDLLSSSSPVSSPTSSPTPSESYSPSPNASSTPVESVSIIPSPTILESPTVSPSATPTPTESVIPSNTPIATASATPTPTPTETLTPTPSPTSTPTPEEKDKGKGKVKGESAVTLGYYISLVGDSIQNYLGLPVDFIYRITQQLQGFISGAREQSEPPVILRDKTILETVTPTPAEHTNFNGYIDLLRLDYYFDSVSNRLKNILDSMADSTTVASSNLQGFIFWLFSVPRLY
ncbi:MAG: polymorphic outer membrane protein [Parcubacteria group bacterium Licking1014_17]|nr:MAG: polymorphic outer membrane protein [Parcubacteria group bacterium Licking1014_17]